MINNSAAECSIWLKFGTYFDNVTLGQWCRSQREMVVAESNGNARILIRSCEKEVYTHAQYKMVKNSPEERLAQRRAALKVQCIAIATFSSLFSVMHRNHPTILISPVIAETQRSLYKLIAS